MPRRYVPREKFRTQRFQFSFSAAEMARWEEAAAMDGLEGQMTDWVRRALDAAVVRAHESYAIRARIGAAQSTDA